MMKARTRKKLYNSLKDAVITLLVLELTYINAKSLLFLVSEMGVVDKVFAIIGSISYSSVTVLIMRTDGRGWKRFIFPLMDGLLVFSGFNVRFVGHLLDNWLALALSIFFAVFTALILFALGQSNTKKKAA